MALANVEKTNVEKNVEDVKNDETEEDDTKNSTAGSNKEEDLTNMRLVGRISEMCQYRGNLLHIAVPRQLV